MFKNNNSKHYSYTDHYRPNAIKPICKKYHVFIEDKYNVTQ